MNPRITRCLAILAVLGLTGLLSAAQWDEMAVHDGVAYFAFPSPLVIERYDMATQSISPPIGLTSSPSAMTVDADAIYVSYLNGNTVRIEHDGSGETVLLTTPGAATGLVVDGDFLFVTVNDDAWSVNKSTGVPIDTADYFYNMVGLSIAPSVDSFFARSTGVSPSDIIRVDYDALGNLLGQDDSVYHGDYPGASRTWVLPGETHVVDSSGTVYTTASLLYAGSLGQSFDDLGFNEDTIVVSRGSTLHRYSLAFAPLGSAELPSAPENLAVLGETIYVFRDGTGPDLLDVELVDMEDLEPQQPGPPVDPVGLAYAPDRIELGADGTLYLLSIEHLSVFGWNTATGSYESSIPLIEAPSLMAYSGVTNTLYLAHESKYITQIPLDDSTIERHFTTSPQVPVGLSTANEYVFVCDPTGAWVSHFTYHPDGTMIDQEEWNYFSAEYVWSATNSRMYHFRDGTSPNDLIWEVINPDGTIGSQMDSPYHSSTGIQHPIRVNPDGSVVVLGSGRVYNALSLELIDELPNSISDATWLGGKLYTIRPFGGDTQVQSWFPTYTQDETWIVSGTPERIFTVGDELIAVTMVGGIPVMTVIDTCPSDIDDDGIIGFVDLLDVLSQWGPCVGCPPDIDGDGVVGMSDLMIIMTKWGPCP
jgi:hypothetical protein